MKKKTSLLKQLFLLALRRWGRFARNNVTSASRWQKFDQEKRKIEQIWMWKACVAGAKRGGKGRERKARKKGKGREPLPSLPNPPVFSLSPYPLPLPTPATQARYRTPDCQIYYVNIDFLSLRRRRSSARNVPSGEERVRKLLRHCGGRTRQVIWELIFVQGRASTVWSIGVVELIECVDWV